MKKQILVAILALVVVSLFALCFARYPTLTLSSDDIVSISSIRMNKEHSSTVVLKLSPDLQCKVSKGYGHAISWDLTFTEGNSERGTIYLASDYGPISSQPKCWVVQVNQEIEVITVQPSGTDMRGLKTYGLMQIGMWRWKEIDGHYTPISVVKRLHDLPGTVVQPYEIRKP